MNSRRWLGAKDPCLSNKDERWDCTCLVISIAERKEKERSVTDGIPMTSDVENEKFTIKKINNKARGTTRDQMFVFFSEMYKTTRYDGSTSTDVCEDSSSTKTWSDGRRRGCAVSADLSLQSSPFTSLLSLRLGDGREVKAASAPKYPPPPPSRRKQGGTYL